MSEAKAVEAVNSVLAAVFSEGSPEWVTGLVPDLVGYDRVVDGKVAVGVGSRGGSLWASAEPDEREFTALLRKRWGEATAFLSSVDVGIGQFLLQVTADGARLLGTRKEPKPVDGGLNMGLVRDLVTGEPGVLTAHESAPVGLFEGQDARTSAMAALPQGQWLARWRADTAQSAMVMIAGPDAAACARVADLVPSLKPVLAAARGAELTVSVMVIEVGDEGAFDVSAWLSWGVDRSLELPEIFSAGLPTAEAFAASFDDAFFESDRQKAHSLMVERVVPQLVGGVDPGVARERLSHLWLALSLKFSVAPPFQRAEVVEEAAQIADAIGLQRRCMSVAAARYLAEHEEAPPPPFEVPAKWMAMSVQELVVEAEALAAKVEEAAGAAALADHYNGLNEVVNLQAARANIQAAISGSFIAAQGAIHAYLEGIGPLGYDDDADLAGLEGVDLEGGDEEVTQALLDDDF